MSLMDLIDKARELIGGGGIDTLTENAGELSDIAQGEGSVVDKAQQALETLGEGGEGGGGAGEASGGPPGGGAER
jgi:hypothetical protein